MDPPFRKIQQASGLASKSEDTRVLNGRQSRRHFSFFWNDREGKEGIQDGQGKI